VIETGRQRSSDAINSDDCRIRGSFSQSLQLSIFRISEEGSDRRSVGKAEHYKTVRFPVPFDDLKLPAANEVFAAVLHDYCRHACGTLRSPPGREYRCQLACTQPSRSPLATCGVCQLTDRLTSRAIDRARTCDRLIRRQHFSWRGRAEAPNSRVHSDRRQKNSPNHDGSSVPADPQVFGRHHPNIPTPRHPTTQIIRRPISIQYRTGVASL